MKFIKILFVLHVLYSSTSAQQAAATYQDGSPAKELRYVDVKGSELLEPDWQPATITVTDGRKFENVKVKYNVYIDEFFFLGQNGLSMAFITQVKEFVVKLPNLSTAIYRNGYLPTGTFTNKSFYQVLADGKMELLKKTTKNIMETKQYNSSIVQKTFVDDSKYYVAINHQPVVLSTDKKKFYPQFEGKEKEIESFVNQNKINLKKQDDLIAVVNYYNGLQ